MSKRKGKNKKHMRGVRHLKRSKRKRDRKSSTNHKDRSYYIGKAIIESRNTHLTYEEWKKTLR